MCALRSVSSDLLQLTIRRSVCFLCDCVPLSLHLVPVSSSHFGLDFILTCLYTRLVLSVQANSLYAEALSALRVCSGEAHPLFAETLKDTADVYRKRGEFVRALVRHIAHTPRQNHARACLISPCIMYLPLAFLLRVLSRSYFFLCIKVLSPKRI